MSKREAIKNRWVYHPKDRCLRFYDGDATELYEVDLEECSDSAEVLDWIVQVHEKTWATPPVFHALVEALDDLLDLQANYCSFGTSKKVVRELLERMKVGWRIYPRPTKEPQKGGGLGVVRASELPGDDEEWFRECDRICREVFGDEGA
jgi:hypothetical protein